MKSRKFLAVGICSVVALGLAQGVNAAEEGVSNNVVPVSYDYSGSAEPVDPKYGVSIPTGLVFTATNTTDSLDISVSMTKAPGEEAILGSCQAKVSVKSANGYKVTLPDNKDAVEYIVKYDTATMSGIEPEEIGLLSNNVGGTENKLKIEGSAKLNGVATKTGSHTDTLTYTITNVTVSQN